MAAAIDRTFSAPCFFCTAAGTSLSSIVHESSRRELYRNDSPRWLTCEPQIAGTMISHTLDGKARDSYRSASAIRFIELNLSGIIGGFYWCRRHHHHHHQLSSLLELRMIE